MIERLKETVKNTNPRVLGQVLKSKHKDLYDWIMQETKILDNVTIKERVWYLINDKPEFICEKGNKKTFNPKTLAYGFCNNMKHCSCMQEHMKKNYKPRDMKIVVEKRKETWLKKYGVDNVSKADAIKQKRSATMSNNDYSKIFRRLKEDKINVGYETVLKRVSNSVTPMFTKEEYQGSSRAYKYSWECNKCKHQFLSHVDYGTFPKCPICYPKTISKAEIDIANFIRDLGENIITNTREILGDQELDIYIPDKKIAIEYNGIYWHSSFKKKSDYHVKKMVNCLKQNIKLIQIFEDEWKNKPEIVKNRLRSILGHDEKIYARKCKIVTLDIDEYKKFTNETHIRGYAPASIKYGLSYNGEIRAIMSFSKSRYTKTGYELIRYCSKGTVVGGASKLLKHFIKHHSPDYIVTYADRCWSDGNLYERLGFTNVTENINNVGYWYIKDGIRYHRSTFTKSRLVKMGYDRSQNEFSIMESLGYIRIYDCGNYKFVLTLKQ